MGRGRGKGKKQLTIAAHEDGSGEEEKLPVKRRGRPTKALKDEVEEEEEVGRIEEEDEDFSNKDVKNQAPLENGKKRKKLSSQAKENPESVEEENGTGLKMNGYDLTKSVGFRQNGSRRKNKPRRAAEVGVECR